MSHPVPLNDCVPAVNDVAKDTRLPQFKAVTKPMEAQQEDNEFAILEKHVDERNKLNDLSATEWISRTISVFIQKGLGKKSNEARIERQHPAPFSFQDVSRFIEFFTKRGEVVLDPFCGVGSTLKASAILNRRSVGVELNPKYVMLAHERMRTELEPALFRSTNYQVIEGDIRTVIPSLKENSIDFVITSPPYWGILNKIDHKAKQERLAHGYDHNYGAIANDLAQIESYKDFIETLGCCFDSIKRILLVKKYGYYSW